MKYGIGDVLIASGSGYRRQKVDTMGSAYRRPFWKNLLFFVGVPLITIMTLVGILYVLQMDEQITLPRNMLLYVCLVAIVFALGGLGYISSIKRRKKQIEKVLTTGQELIGNVISVERIRIRSGPSGRTGQGNHFAVMDYSFTDGQGVLHKRRANMAFAAASAFEQNNSFNLIYCEKTDFVVILRQGT